MKHTLLNTYKIDLFLATATKTLIPSSLKCGHKWLSLCSAQPCAYWVVTVMFTLRRKSRQCHEHQNTVFNIIHSPGRQLRDFFKTNQSRSWFWQGLFRFYYRPQTKFGTSNVFTGFCLSGGWGLSALGLVGGVPLGPGGVSLGLGVVCASGSRVCVAVDTHTHTHTTVNKGAVHILLECFLVLRYGRSILTHLTKRKNKHIESSFPLKWTHCMKSFTW